ncbi:MAG: glycosyltransferase family protein [Methanobacterium sp.]|jgi:spore maturation protein CgeB
MKLLIITSTINLEYRLGCTPAWWQLYKALYEIGNEITVIPYLGLPVESLWWTTSENPCRRESLLYYSLLDNKNKIISQSTKSNLFSNIANFFIKYQVKPKWKKYLTNFLNSQRGFDAIIFMNIPLNHISDIPSLISQDYGIPVIYYDGDMPTILPGYVEKREFKFDYYPGSDLAEYDAFITNSKGVIPDLEKRGANNIHTIHYGVDPDLYSPMDIEKDIDIFYYGHGSQAREKRMNFMITDPSKLLTDIDFLVGGKDFGINLGNSQTHGVIPISEWRYYCSRSKINLNITRDSHAKVYSSSTSRPFELASMGCCVVSDPYNGLEEWFKLGKEMFMVENSHEASEIYKWLIDDDEVREKTASLARKRVLKEHTFRHRGAKLIKIIEKTI